MAPRAKGGTVKRGGASRKPRRDPQVGVWAVDQLPPPASKRSSRYADAMAEVRQTLPRGTWACIAVFDSTAGAAQVKREILAGKRIVDGKVSDWDVESRRTRDEAGELTGSELYVRLRAGAGRSAAK